jgi:plastocyanin
MSKAALTRRVSLIATAGLLAGLLGGGIAMSRATAPAPPAAGREIVLVARDMAYYLPGDPRPNPTLEVARGETVRVVLRNQDPGMEHDFAVPALGAASAPIDGRGSTALTLRAPAARGEHEYLCTLHAVVMRGVLSVR